jgi:hypothetical protein
MRSPLYLLTALLPLLAQASPTPEGEDFDDSVIEERDFCRVQKSFQYWKYPCSSSDTTGHANQGDTVHFICKYKYVCTVNIFWLGKIKALVLTTLQDLVQNPQRMGEGKRQAQEMPYVSSS